MQLQKAVFTDCLQLLLPLLLELLFFEVNRDSAIVTKLALAVNPNCYTVVSTSSVGSVVS